MDATFITGFQTVFIAMVKITMIAAVAGIMVKKAIISDKDVTSLSKITVKLLLPCMIFSSMVTRFDPAEFSWWWMLPLASTLMNIIGLISARLIFNCRFDENRELVAMAALQNSAYLILPIGKALFPENFSTFSNLCFLFVMGNTPVLWCAGKYLISGRGDFRVTDFITPPLITWILLDLFNVPAKMPVVATLLMLQASAAPATGLILQVRTYGGNIQKVSGAMMVAYLCCVFAIPFWIAVAIPV